jgi:NAD(P)H dehydrogenase (quinone)
MKKRKILVLFYSFTSSTAKLAEEIATGARNLAGTDVELKRVPEVIPNSFFKDKPQLRKIKKSLEKKYPEATINDLIKADGIAIGTPVHFGSFASQIKQFIDQLSPVFIKGDMVNKPAAVFCTSGSIHGGEEVALISLIIPLFNLGMIPVGIPYPIQGVGKDFDGGSPYGAIYVTGHKGKNKLSNGDKKVARILGRRLAVMTQLLNCGCEYCGVCADLKKQEK